MDYNNSDFENNGNSILCEENFQEEYLDTEYVTHEDKSKSKIYFGGVIASIIVVFFGLMMIFGAFTKNIHITKKTSSDSTTITDYSYYGGDAYTGIQNAGADASNNAKAVADNVALTNAILVESAKGYNVIQNALGDCLGLLIVSLGVMGFFYFYIGYQREK